MQRISFRDLFEDIGTERMRFSQRAEALSGQTVELRGYLAAMHSDPRQIVLASSAGVCPDCAERPVAYLHLPGFAPGAGLFEAQAVRLQGTLSYGFAIAPEGYASFLRLERASVATGLKPGMFGARRS